MKIKVLFKRLDKRSGELDSIDYKSFDFYNSVEKCRVFNSIIDIFSKSCESEYIYQIETFKEHEVTELDIF